MSPGPRVVALGGGHGTAVTLRAVRRYAGDVVAVVSVADDGGSSGRLRASLGIPPPGDLRRCLVALGDDTRPLAAAFEHRFESGDLEGHPLGNLIIAGLTNATGGFMAAVAEAGRLLGVTGRVLPATADPVVLKALAGGAEIEGQVAVERARGPIASISIVPPDAAAPAEVVAAIEQADQIVIGPGSLFTSVLAVLVVPAVSAALGRTTAPKVYVCNVRAAGETEGFTVADHGRALVAHGVVPDVVLYDPATIPLGTGGPGRLVAADLVDDPLAGHDPRKLAAALSALVE